MTNATSRRSFIRTGTLATAAAITLPAQLIGVEEPAAAPGKIHLGVASYSFHKFNRAKVIEFMHQLNTPWLNAKDVNDHLPMTPADATLEALAAYKAANITLTGGGVIYFPKADEADVQAKFEYCKRAGLSLIIAGPTHDSLPVVEKFAKQYDMRVAIHNHGPEDKEWPSPLDILKVISSMDPRMGLCIDVGHTARAGTDVIEAIRKTGPRLFDLHIKDLADMSAKESQVAVGDGKMPIRAIFQQLVAMGYQGFADLEYEIHEDDPLPGMMKSFAYMRGVLAGLGYHD